jgi:hypothetical protein
MATMVTRTRFNVTLNAHSLSCYNCDLPLCKSKGYVFLLLKDRAKNTNG